ncbi:MAG: 30S ribosomal protein S16 [Patescibacteria group bacterium]
MISIRLQRVGRKNASSFRVVVMEKTRDPQAKHLELLGHYNPRMNPKTIELNAERIKFWIGKGAEISDTLWNLFIDQKIIDGKKKTASRISKKRTAKTGEKEAVKKEEEAKKNAKAEAEKEKVAEAPAEEVKPKEPKQEVVEEKPVEEPKAEEAPAEEAKPEEAPAEETPVEEKPVEEAPTEEKPAEDKPEGETKSE